MNEEIINLKNKIVEELAPLKVYLFGSYALGKQRDDSDFDIYVVVKDGKYDMVALTARAYKAIRYVQNRPVDIVVGTEKHFNEKKDVPSLEYDVFNKGVLIYE